MITTNKTVPWPHHSVALGDRLWGVGWMWNNHLGFHPKATILASSQSCPYEDTERESVCLYVCISPKHFHTFYFPILIFLAPTSVWNFLEKQVPSDSQFIHFSIQSFLHQVFRMNRCGWHCSELNYVPQRICPNPNPIYLWMWANLEIGGALFPGGPVGKSLYSQCRRHGFNPWSGTKIPHVTQWGKKK